MNTILAVGKFVDGDVHLRVAPPPVTVCDADIEAVIDSLFAPVDGTLQDMIDFAAEADEMEQDMLDREYWSRGEW